MIQEKHFKPLLVLCIWLLLPATGLTTPIDNSATIPEAKQKFGKLNQKDVKSCVSEKPNEDLFGNGCGPVSTVNSFAFLEKEYPFVYGDKLIISQKKDLNGDGKSDEYDNLIATAESLASSMDTQPDGPNKGTFIYDFIQGKESYFKTLDLEGETIVEALVHPDKKLADDSKVIKPDSVTRKIPTWQFIKENLSDREDLEVLVNRVDLDDKGKVINIDINFGHYITVFSFDWIDKNMDDIIGSDEGGAWSYIDPRGGVVKEKIGIFQNILNGPILAIGPSSGKTFAVTALIKESPIDKDKPVSTPEPGILALMSIGLGLIVFFRARNR